MGEPQAATPREGCQMQKADRGHTILLLQTVQKQQVSGQRSGVALGCVEVGINKKLFGMMEMF